MNNGFEIPFDRVTYKDGQKLTARDLEDDRKREVRLRGLHARFFHETWGIALGLEIFKTKDDKPIDDKSVRLKPGHAIDYLGRDILLAETIQLPVPHVVGAENFVLTLSYQEDIAFRERTDIKQVCLGDGLDPRFERPIIQWLRPDEVDFGSHVPVIQVVVENGTIRGKVDERVRRYARPLQRPHIVSGVTERGRSGWREWIEGDNLQLGLELFVDTTEAGFIKSPLYFAILHCDLHMETVNSADGDLQKSALILDGHRFITDAKQDGFIYRIARTDQFPADDIPSAAQAEERKWFISWFGLEPVTGCNVSVPQYFFLWSGFQVLSFS